MGSGSVRYAVIDKRVQTGSVSKIGLTTPVNWTFNVDGATGLLTVLKDIKKKTGKNKISVLTLVAHGETVQDQASGGYYYTLEFCKERVHIHTAVAFKLLAGCFASSRQVGVELLACGSHNSPNTAKLGPAVSKTLISQGIKLAQTIADATGAVVRASPDTQKVGISVRQDRSNPSVLRQKATVNPGPWEGREWYFFPKGRTPFRKTTGGGYAVAKP